MRLPLLNNKPVNAPAGENAAGLWLDPDAHPFVLVLDGAPYARFSNLPCAAMSVARANVPCRWSVRDEVTGNVYDWAMCRVFAEWNCRSQQYRDWLENWHNITK